MKICTLFMLAAVLTVSQPARALSDFEYDEEWEEDFGGGWDWGGGYMEGYPDAGDVCGGCDVDVSGMLPYELPGVDGDLTATDAELMAEYYQAVAIMEERFTSVFESLEPTEQYSFLAEAHYTQAVDAVLAGDMDAALSHADLALSYLASIEGSGVPLGDMGFMQNDLLTLEWQGSMPLSFIDASGSLTVLDGSFVYVDVIGNFHFMSPAEMQAALNEAGKEVEIVYEPGIFDLP